MLFRSNRGDSSRLFLKARNAGMAYTVNSGMYNGRDFAEFYIIDHTDPHLALQLFELCLTELGDIRDGNFTTEELERAIGYEAGGCDTEYETSRDLANWYAPLFSSDEPLYSPSEFAAAVRNVKKDDVVRVLDKFIAKDNWMISLVGHGAKSKEAEFIHVIQESLHKTT